MASLFGNPNERWPLSRAVDALVASARRAGFPGLLWSVGLVYPSLGLGLGVVRDILEIVGATTEVSFELLRDWGIERFLTRPDPLPGPGTLLSLGDSGEIGESALKLVLLVPIARLVVGLARLTDLETWRRASSGRRPPKLRAAWRGGKGLGASAFGLILTFPLLFFGAVLFLLGPVVLLLNLLDVPRYLSSVLALVLMPVGAVVLGYGILLQVLVQLALHSLARNGRGSASALTHAWRLVRNSPWSAVRATVVDLALQCTILVVAVVLEQLFETFGVAVAWLLWCFVGVTRAGYWARTYDALGGLSTLESEARVTTGLQRPSAG